MLFIYKCKKSKFIFTLNKKDINNINLNYKLKKAFTVKIKSLS